MDDNICSHLRFACTTIDLARITLQEQGGGKRFYKKGIAFIKISPLNYASVFDKCGFRSLAIQYDHESFKLFLIIVVKKLILSTVGTF